ncbi:hypothetical protein [Natronincola ferrireducens]|uniref:SipL SPOCS domain-containing protein n=1 Tax=Natronincola ferrireducens TaxID=393762 RepID=A0A1G9CR35_9FIRM|nr:hypothetical protein [Natronincola ferrireducens]SDK54079.1 hypothetical protein SAMN05660472_01533 [Natronincola ferrireducens]
MENNSKDSTYVPDFQPVSIIADKVYAHYKERECFELIKIPLQQKEEFEFVDITFHPGEIIDETLVISPIHNRPNFSRVRFTAKLTFDLRVKSIRTGATINIVGRLPDISKDIVVYIPEARDEFTFKIDIETASRTLAVPREEDGHLLFAIGVFMIVKVIGRVQLLIPEFGFCPEPPDCEEFVMNDICEDFDLSPFPEFFPKQFELTNNIL